jgi:hypothetical protein
MATTALKLPAKATSAPKAPSAPIAPETSKAIEAAAAATSEATTVANLAQRTVRFTSALPDFVFREGGRKIEFRNGIYDATGDEILLLRHAAGRAWWLAEVVN